MRRVAWPLVGLWLLAGAALSSVTAQVRDWYVMTDELVYERLAISIARTGSPLPEVHGVVVRSLDQLYPLLLAPFFASGLVAHDLTRAHFLNAWLMSSACIPAFLLARRVTGNRAAAYAVAALATLVPWFVYAPFLLTEVVAYPLSLWAALAIQRTTVAPSVRNDVLALGAILLAFLARTQFLVLVVVFPLTLLAYGGVRETVRAHRVAVAFTGALVLSGIGLVAAGGNLATLTVYGQQVGGGLIPPGMFTSYLKHVAMLALGLALLPFVAGAGWLLANLVSRGRGERRAFACYAAIVAIVLPGEVTSYDLHVGGGIVRDRYLFYLAPLLVIAFVCAVRERPRWWMLLPGGIAAAGFALGAQPHYAWDDPYARLVADTPVAGLLRPLVGWLGGTTATRALLAAAAIALPVAFVLLRPRAAAIAAGVVLLFLPLETVYLFDRLLSVDGVASRPLTASPAAKFDWVDRTLGTGADVAMVPAPINENWFQTEQYWRDLEFWNTSVDRDVHTQGEPFSFTGSWFPKVDLAFDPATGRANHSPGSYVVEALKETRFRISGPQVGGSADVLLVRADRPWRADWVSYGLYDDGWTRPHVAARVRVFARPGERRARIRYLSFQIWAPPGAATVPFTVSSNRETHRDAAGGGTKFVTMHVCVPAGGFGDVRLTTPGVSPIPGDLADEPSSTSSREGGVFVAQIALSDDVGGSCRA